MFLRPSIGGLLLLAAPFGFCQKATSPPASNPPSVAAKAGGTVGTAKAPAPAQRMANPLTPATRFLNMTPEEQERVMEKATPQQQVQLQTALDRFNRLPPAQRARVLRQYQSLARLSPQQQAVVARQIAAFNHLPEDRIKVVREELLQLLQMPPDQRSARLAGEEFSARYSPFEGQILKDLATNFPADYPITGR